MKAASFVVLAAALFAGTACNEDTVKECASMQDAMKPLDQGTPTSATVDSVAAKVASLQLKNQTLSIYAKNYGQTLTVLSNTLKLQEGPNAPDGTADVVKKNLTKARTDAGDVKRFCAQ
ncbi:MAG TPA: hypothetical protein VIY73_16690 [Polyangiaceae bacterium]